MERIYQSTDEREMELERSRQLAADRAASKKMQVAEEKRKEQEQSNIHHTARLIASRNGATIAKAGTQSLKAGLERSVQQAAMQSAKIGVRSVLKIVLLGSLPVIWPLLLILLPFIFVVALMWFVGRLAFAESQNV